MGIDHSNPYIPRTTVLCDIHSDHVELRDYTTIMHGSHIRKTELKTVKVDHKLYAMFFLVQMAEYKEKEAEARKSRVSVLKSI